MDPILEELLFNLGFTRKNFANLLLLVSRVLWLVCVAFAVFSLIEHKKSMDGNFWILVACSFICFFISKILRRSIDSGS
jgi:hypothetical protein